MKTRTLWKQGLEVSEVRLGCIGFTQSYPPYPDRKGAIATLHRVHVVCPPWIVPIPGTERIERIKENIGGADIHFIRRMNLGSDITKTVENLNTKIVVE